MATTFLGQLTDSERGALQELGIKRPFPRDAILMFEGEPSERAMIVLSGRVKISRLGDDGHEILLSIRDPGDIVGELGAIDEGPRVASVTALDPVEALVISAQTFRAHLERT